MSTETEKLVERLHAIWRDDDHARGCEGRTYDCTCGFDERSFQTARDAAAALQRLQGERDEWKAGAEEAEKRWQDDYALRQAAEAQVEAMRKALEDTPENTRAAGAVIDAAWSRWCGGRSGLDGADHMAGALLAHLRALSALSAPAEERSSGTSRDLSHTAGSALEMPSNEWLAKQARSLSSAKDDDSVGALAWNLSVAFRRWDDEQKATAKAEESAVYPDWRPIETAPKDGSRILLWWQPCTSPSVGCWATDDEDHPGWAHTPVRAGWISEGDQCIPVNQADCTHWHPLPTAPAEARSAKATPTTYEGFALRVARVEHSGDEGFNWPEPDDPDDARATVDMLVAEARDLISRDPYAPAPKAQGETE